MASGQVGKASVSGTEDRRFESFLASHEIIERDHRLSCGLFVTKELKSCRGICYTESMKKFSKADQRLMATWALDCAERVLPLFEQVSPQDDRPRKAIETGRKWVEDGIFSMPVIRSASLSAHSSAKEVDPKSPACFAAHAAGQAVAIAHVPQHAYGGAYYALKAISARNPKTR